MSPIASLFAQRRDLLQDFEARMWLWANTALTLLAIGLLIWAVMKLRNWMFGGEDREVSTEELLTEYRELKQQGALTDDEYRSISRRLIQPEKPPPETVRTVPAATDQPDPSTLTDLTSTESDPSEEPPR